MKSLHFREDGTFRIMQLTDIHYCENNEMDFKTVELIGRLIEKEKPDFIMITGDTVYGEHNLEYLPYAMAPVVKSQIPYSFCFGNHDTENGHGYQEMFEAVTKLPGCMAFHDETSGTGMGNHSIQVVNKEGTPIWVLFGMDSGNYSELEHIEGYAYVKRPQIDWYQKQIKEYEKMNPDFAALLFMHIALPEYHELWDMEVCYGEKREGICSPRLNTGFFAAMQQSGHTKGVFVGHDHINDFYGTMFGITLGYGRASGYNTYGNDDFPRGARIFTLYEDVDKGFDTYVSLSDDTIINRPAKHIPERIRDKM